jgi:hypothetical protein
VPSKRRIAGLNIIARSNPEQRFRMAPVSGVRQGRQTDGLSQASRRLKAWRINRETIAANPRSEGEQVSPHAGHEALKQK